MGGGNPVKQFMDFNVDRITKSFETATNAVGLSGVSDASRGVSDMGKGINMVVTGEDKVLRKKAEQAADEANRQALAAANKRAADAAAAESSRLDQKRMKGTGTRTLLTGPSGLLDDETSMSRKTLLGM